MKKQFFFAAAAVAALASCSSSDDVLSTGAPEVGASDQQIVLGVNAPAAILDVTRGTGTVGSTDPSANDWAGQKFNVYMLDKGTTDLTKDANDVALYENAEMIAPNGDFTTTPAGVAKLASGELRYYPISGASDFYAYRADGANADDPALVGDAYKVEVTIDGSQDIMVAKTDEIAAADLTAANLTAADVYSAKAARAGITPTLNFTHELTRLAFNVIGGNADAISTTKVSATDDPTVVKGYAPTEPSNPITKQVIKDKTNGTFNQGVYVDSIQVKSLTTGELVCTGSAQGLKLTANEALLILKQRPAAGTDADDLVDLVAVKPTSTSAKTPVGEALLVNPVATSLAQYEVTVTLHQYVPLYDAEYLTVSGGTQMYTFNQSTKTYTVVLPVDQLLTDGVDTTKGYSFNINMKVYSVEKVEINADLTPWKPGGEADLDIE